MASGVRPTEKVVGVNDDLELRQRGYLMGSTLGEGSYAKVKLAFSDKLNKKVALKIINRKKAPKDFQAKFLPRELEILKLLNHPHVIRMHEIMQFNDKIFIVIELAGHGDLLEYVKLRGSIVEDRARVLFSQLVSAIEYLHGLNIVHRDLKCENVLLDSSNNIKLSDFGFSRILGPTELSRTFCGSAAYAAPEVLLGIPYHGPSYDVWSLGVILYIMVCSTMPYNDSDIKKMIKYQTERKVCFQKHIKLSQDCRDLIHRILEAKIEQRITIPEIKRSNWINDSARRSRQTSPSSGAAGTAAADAVCVRPIEPRHAVAVTAAVAESSGPRVDVKHPGGTSTAPGSGSPRVEVVRTGAVGGTLLNHPAPPRVDGIAPSDATYSSVDRSLVAKRPPGVEATKQLGTSLIPTYNNDPPRRDMVARVPDERAVVPAQTNAHHRRTLESRLETLDKEHNDRSRGADRVRDDDRWQVNDRFVDRHRDEIIRTEAEAERSRRAAETVLRATDNRNSVSPHGGIIQRQPPIVDASALHSHSVVSGTDMSGTGTGNSARIPAKIGDDRGFSGSRGAAGVNGHTLTPAPTSLNNASRKSTATTKEFKSNPPENH